MWSTSAAVRSADLQIMSWPASAQGRLPLLPLYSLLMSCRLGFVKAVVMQPEGALCWNLEGLAWLGLLAAGVLLISVAFLLPLLASSSLGVVRSLVAVLLLLVLLFVISPINWMG